MIFHVILFCPVHMSPVWVNFKIQACSVCACVAPQIHSISPLSSITSVCSCHYRAVRWISFNKEVIPEFVSCSLSFNQEAVISSKMMGLNFYQKESG